VVALSPLVAIDLLVRNERDELLVGMRVNSPTKGWGSAYVVLAHTFRVDALAQR
jgi:hypothetical protein